MNGTTQSGNSRKKGLDPKLKVRLQALILIGILVIPGNLVTLLIYSSTNAGAYIFSCSYTYIVHSTLKFLIEEQARSGFV